MFLTPPGNDAGVVTVRLLTMDRVKLFVVKSRGIVLSVARMVTFDAAHLPNVEQADRFSDVVGEFLNS